MVPMNVSTAPRTAPASPPAKLVFDKYKAIIENTKQVGDFFQVNYDGESVDGNVTDRSADNKTLEAHTTVKGYDEAQERWEIRSADGVDNMMYYTRVPIDGTPGVAKLYWGNFKLGSHVDVVK